MTKWILIVMAIILSCVAVACISLSREHREAMNIEINDFDFKHLQDGTYRGTYDGGMHQWRANEVQVTVLSGNVTAIELVESTEKRPPEFTEELFKRVIEEQSLQVDAISGATLTSKACLKAIEHALTQAEQKSQEQIEH
jgi:uncharacterized protein with FMN-binding domain